MPSSFSNILFDTSASNLPLPADFAHNHLNSKITNCPVIIQSANGGYSWKLKIKQISDGYCFSDGWSDVVKDSQLCFGDFLLFQPLDESTFKLSIYGPDCREKILPPKISGGGDGCISGEVENVAGETTDGGGDEEDENYEKNEDPCFTTILTRTHRSMLKFPGEFAELVGMDEERTMTVKNHDGKEWAIRLMLDKAYRHTKKYYLSSGWHRFHRENELSEGDECVFRFIKSEGKLLLAKVTKNKWSVVPYGRVPVPKVDVGPAEMPRRRLPQRHKHRVPVPKVDVGPAEMPRRRKPERHKHGVRACLTANRQFEKNMKVGPPLGISRGVTAIDQKGKSWIINFQFPYNY